MNSLIERYYEEGCVRGVVRRSLDFCRGFAHHLMGIECVFAYPE